MDWLDKKIQEQKHNIDIMKRVCDPFEPADLQEKKERGELDE